MRILHAAIILPIAFLLAYVATPRTSEPLHAQVGVPCDCTWKGGPLGPVTKACLGRGDMSSISCSQVGSQCFIAGTATWVPVSPTCVLGGSTHGWIAPYAGATGTTVYFDPSTNPGPISWNITSPGCSGLTFGAEMRVRHAPWTPGSDCSCLPGAPTTTPIVYGAWGCNTI